MGHIREATAAPLRWRQSLAAWAQWNWDGCPLINAARTPLQPDERAARLPQAVRPSHMVLAYY